MLRRAAQSFAGDVSGSVAAIFGLSLVPLVALVGVATDYSRAVNLRANLQVESDKAALVLAAAGPGQKAAMAEQILAEFKRRVTSAFGSQLVTELVVQGQWLNATDYQVGARTAIANNLLKAIPSMATQTTVGVVTVARLTEGTPAGAPPRMAQLDPEAGDYNRIYAYCFKPKTSGKKDKDKDKDNDKAEGTEAVRSQMTAIADNAGTYYSVTMPSCKGDETTSYRLYNVRDARTNRSMWDNPSAERYDYYSDTTASGGVQTMNFEDNIEILETVICASFATCKPKTQGGVLTEGKNRNPERATGSCDPGKFMYYGWEDRPPGRGWTDRDYDDIRLIVECPSGKVETQKQVWLVK